MRRSERSSRSSKPQPSTAVRRKMKVFLLCPPLSHHCSNACPSKPADDEEQLREELGDLIDDNPIEEDSSSSESGDDEPGGTKRKRDDDDELDDRLSEDKVRVTTYF